MRLLLLQVFFWITLWASAGPPEAPAPRQVLFICTGNYYRSRFAEALFNAKARAAHLNWRAISRGLGLVASQKGLSPWAQQELRKRGVVLEAGPGAPTALTREDLAKSDYVVLLNESEHRPMLEKRFPGQDERKIHGWQVPDIGKMKPALACQEMDRAIAALIGQLEKGG